jgi:Mce-associated membrane protein
MTRARLGSLAAPVLAVALLLASGWLAWDWNSRRDADAAGRDAMAAARDSIAAMGSYRPGTAEQSLTAARDRLTGDFLDTYTQTIRTVVIPDATRRKMTSVVTVPAIGVVSAQHDRAVLLAYVDQSLTIGADADAKPAANPSRYRVTMDNVDGRWLVAGFERI